MRKLDSDLAEGIMLKAGWKPLEPYKNHRHRWKSECLTCTKISEPTLKNVKKKGTGCSYCKKLKVDEGDAIQFMISAGYLPKTKYVNSKTNWKCECLRCGELVEPTLDRIRSGIGGCKKCGTKDMMDKKRTEQDVAIAIARSRNYEPLEPYLGRHHKWKCKCLKCGQITEPRLSSMQQGAECKNCAKGGFNRD